MRRPVHPAQPQRREAVDFRERAAHHGIVGGRHQLDTGFVVVAAHVFGVCRVQHQQHAGRQLAAQALDLVEWHVGAGRVVGVGQEHQPRTLGHRREDRVDVGRVGGLLRLNRRAARGKRRDPIDQEAVPRVDHLVARADEGMRQQVQQLIGAGAADNARRIESERPPDRLPQQSRGAVGIVVQGRSGRAIGLDRLLARAERRFVRRQLEHALDAGRRALARHIGVDRQHAGTRFGTGHSHSYSRSFDGHRLLTLPSPGEAKRASARQAPAARLHAAPYSGSRGSRRGSRSAPRRRR